MAGDPAEEVVVASVGDGDGVVPGRVGGLRGGGVASPVLRVGHLHHVVELRVVLEDWETKQNNNNNNNNLNLAQEIPHHQQIFIHEYELSSSKNPWLFVWLFRAQKQAQSKHT